VKSKLLLLVLALVLAMPVFAAATPAEEHVARDTGNTHWILVAAAVAMAFASAFCGLAQGKAVSAACEGMGRNPGAAAAIRGITIFGLVFIESLALYTFAVAAILLFAKTA
jgi:F-type H+-transporting ATPase subunit c